MYVYGRKRKQISSLFVHNHEQDGSVKTSLEGDILVVEVISMKNNHRQMKRMNFSIPGPELSAFEKKVNEHSEFRPPCIKPGESDEGEENTWKRIHRASYRKHPKDAFQKVIEILAEKYPEECKGEKSSGPLHATIDALIELYAQKLAEMAVFFLDR